jgi:hypothetical protein
MIYLNGRPIDNIADTTSRFQTILTMIPGGIEWLRWAIKDTRIPALNVSSEEELLFLIQDGLNTTTDIRFNAFRLSLDKLINMPEADVEQLATFRNTVFDNAAQLQNLLNRNNLISYEEINEVTRFITSEQLNDSAIFRFPSFSELLKLSVLVNQLNDIEETQKKQAILFAKNNSTSIYEFMDLVSFFIYSAQQLVSKKLAQSMQNSEIQLYYDTLLPFTNHLLFTPNAGSGKNELQLKDELKQLAGSTKFIGYATNASAIYNLIQNVDLQNQNETGIHTQIESYLATIKNLVGSTTPMAGQYTQDGKLITFRIENEQTLAMIGVDTAGNVFLLPETKIKQPS